MSTPRAEDVKEAPSDLSPEMEAVYEVVDRLWHDLEALFGALLPLAKGGLASQEQTPDYMSRDWLVRLANGIQLVTEGQRYDKAYLAEQGQQIRAALVGFHPQPEGDER